MVLYFWEAWIKYWGLHSFWPLVQAARIKLTFQTLSTEVNLPTKLAANANNTHTWSGVVNRILCLEWFQKGVHIHEKFFECQHFCSHLYDAARSCRCVKILEKRCPVFAPAFCDSQMLWHLNPPCQQHLCENPQRVTEKSSVTKNAAKCHWQPCLF